MATTIDALAYADARPDERATEHRLRAMRALADTDPTQAAIVHALLAVEARLDELVDVIARRS